MAGPISRCQLASKKCAVDAEHTELGFVFTSAGGSAEKSGIESICSVNWIRVRGNWCVRIMRVRIEWRIDSR